MQTYQLRINWLEGAQELQHFDRLEPALDAIIQAANTGSLLTVTLIRLVHEEMFTYTDPRHQAPV